MNMQLTNLDIYTTSFEQMLPVLLDSYKKAKANHLIEEELNLMQEEGLETLPSDMHEVIMIIREMTN